MIITNITNATWGERTPTVFRPWLATESESVSKKTEGRPPSETTAETETVPVTHAAIADGSCGLALILWPQPLSMERLIRAGGWGSMALTESFSSSLSFAESTPP